MHAPSALAQYDRLLRHDPDNVDYLFGKAQILILSGRPEAARPLRQRARALSPAHEEAWRRQPGMLAELSLKRLLQQPATTGSPAATDIGDASSPSPDGALMSGLAVELEAASVKLHAPGALAQYDRLLRRDPDNVDYLFGKALVLVWSGQPGAARSLLQRARTLNPAYEELWRLQLGVLSELGLERQTQELARQARQKFPKSRWDIPQKPAKSPTVAESDQATIPPPGGVLAPKSAVEPETVMPPVKLYAPGALAQYDRLLLRDPDNVDYLFGKAQVLVLSGQSEAARTLLRRARTLNPGHEEVWRLQLRVLSALGLERQVQGLVRQARQKFPLSSWNLPQKPEKLPATTDLRPAAPPAPGGAPVPLSAVEPETATDLASLHVPGALAQYDRLLLRDPDNVDHLFGKAQILVLSGQTEAARTLLRRARALNPEHEEVWRFQLGVLSELGLERQMQELVRQARQKFPLSRWNIPKKPANSPAATGIGAVSIPSSARASVSGATPEPEAPPAKLYAPGALAQYDRLLLRDPDNIDYLFGKAQVLVLSGQPGAARPMLRRARTLNPASEEVWRLQLRVLSELGLERQVQELVRQARQKFPLSRWDIPQANRGESAVLVRERAGGPFACDPLKEAGGVGMTAAKPSGVLLANPWTARSEVVAGINPIALPALCGDPVPQIAAAPVTGDKASSPPSKSAESPISFDNRPPPYDPTLRETGAGSAAAERPPASRSGQPDGVTPVAADATPGGLGWGLAPIRWGGSAGLQMNRTSRDGGSQSTDLMEIVNLRGATYIYQPWLAQVTGNLGLSTTQANASSGTQAAGQGNDTRQKSSSVTGGGSLNLFPSSRFPFLATLDVSDSRNSSELVNTGYTNTRLGLRQSYNPEAGNYNVVAGYNGSTVNFGGQGSDTVNALFGDFSRNTEIQSMQANLNYSQSARSLTGDNASLLNLNARHTYRALDNLSIDSLVSLSDNNLRYLGGTSGATRSHGRYLQFNSFANWHPEEDEEGNEIPLNVNVGVRALSAQSESDASSTGAQSLGANLSATYRYNQNLALTGNGVVTSIATEGGDSQVLALFGGGASYVGDPLTFGKFSYYWNAGASGNQQTGGKEGGNQTLTGQFGHSLYRPVELGEKSSMNFTLGQNVAETSSGLFGNTTSLSHNAGVAYRAAFGESLNGTASLNLSDTMTTGANAGGHFTNLNLLLSGQAQLSRYSSGSINMTFQRAVTSSTSVQSAPPESGIGIFNTSNRNDSTNVFGSVTYQHQRVFGVPKLRYYMNFNANTLASSRDERLAGNANASVENQTYSFDNRLDYRIGRLDFQLRGAVTELAGKKNAMIFLKVTREFGRF